MGVPYCRPGIPGRAPTVRQQGTPIGARPCIILICFSIDIRYVWRYKGSMKTKTSITLSRDILRAIDAHMAGYRSRSDFLETAARVFIEHLEKKEAELRDLEIINRHAEALNDEAEDVLGFQAPI